MKNSLYSIILRLMLLICICIFVFNMFRKVLGSSSLLNFDSFFTNLSNFNSMTIDFKITSFNLTQDWGFFNALRDFFNIFLSAGGVIVWLGVNLINLLLFLVQFLQVLFV